MLRKNDKKMLATELKVLEVGKNTPFWQNCALTFLYVWVTVFSNICQIELQLIFHNWSSLVIIDNTFKN